MHVCLGTGRLLALTAQCEGGTVPTLNVGALGGAANGSLRGRTCVGGASRCLWRSCMKCSSEGWICWGPNALLLFVPSTGESELLLWGS